MNITELLKEVNDLVTKDRNMDYGSPEYSFEEIARLWSVYLGKTILSKDIAIMMALLKIARLKADCEHADSWKDALGYLAIGASMKIGEADSEDKKPGDKKDNESILMQYDDKVQKRELFITKEQGDYIVGQLKADEKITFNDGIVLYPDEYDKTRGPGDILDESDIFLYVDEDKYEYLLQGRDPKRWRVEYQGKTVVPVIKPITKEELSIYKHGGELNI